MKAAKAVGRKDFIKKSFAGAAGIAFVGSARASLHNTEPPLQQSERKIIYRTLGKTGLKLPIVSMGVMNSDNPALIAAALDNGIVHLDTAHGYMRGRNEEIIGRVLKGRPRDSFVIATKIADDKMESAKETEKVFLDRFNLSLKRLGLDYVEILYLHSTSNRADTLHEPFLNALQAARKSGKTRFVGVSTHSRQPEVIQAAIDSKIYDVVLTGYNFTDSGSGVLREAIAKAAKAGLGIVAMKTLGGGTRRGVTVNPKAALKWVLQDTNVHTTIPGFTTFDQLHTDLSVMEDLALTREEQEDLKLQGSVPGLYCLGCETCTGQCPKNLPIPDMMRAYMYTYGHRNLGAAQDLLLSLDVSSDPCRGCPGCTVSCAKGFDVAERISDVVRLRDVPSSFIA
ncbi:MAG: aldo/keto reductase [Fidelibacterota bacterium]|nr:MAG: aldo/keto reductase [Candidatus Neomarinimicrobiota bacterium]